MIGRAPRASGGAEAGYNLAVLVILITVLNVMMAMAMPLWSQAIQRDKEEELIARGLQYAQAIQVFQIKYGRLPVRLEELVEIEPRSIRQLFPDPMTEGGEWGLLHQVPGAGGQNLAGGGPPEDENPARRGQGGFGGQRPPGGQERGGFGRNNGQGTVTIGPISGVFSQVEDEAIKTFFGSNKINQWHFHAQLLSTGGGFGVPAAQGPIVNVTSSRWLGRPWRPGIVPPQVQIQPAGAGGPGGPGGGPQGPNQVPGGAGGGGFGGGQQRPNQPPGGGGFGGGQPPRGSSGGVQRTGGGRG